MQRTRAARITAALAVLVFAAAEARAAARIEFEIAAGDGFSALDQQKWLRFLTGLKVDGLRIHRARGSAPIKIENLGTDASPRYRVNGAFNSRGELVVPGGRFGLRDGGELTAWMDKLKSGGPDAVLPGAKSERLPYGLSRDQLTSVRADLGRKVDFETLGKPRDEVFAGLRRLLRYEVALHRSTYRVIEETDAVAAELKGMACGTALSYILRPAGLALEVRPPSERTGMYYVVISGKSSEEPWPVGLPPTESRLKTAPKLFEVLPAKVEDFALDDALAAIQKRVEVPFLWDRNALVRHGIEPSEVKVNIPQRKMTYFRLIGAALAQGKLKAELRVDEADQPFLWITSFRR